MRGTSLVVWRLHASSFTAWAVQDMARRIALELKKGRHLLLVCPAPGDVQRALRALCRAHSEGRDLSAYLRGLQRAFEDVCERLGVDGHGILEKELAPLKASLERVAIPDDTLLRAETSNHCERIAIAILRSHLQAAHAQVQAGDAGALLSAVEGKGVDGFEVTLVAASSPAGQHTAESTASMLASKLRVSELVIFENGLLSANPEWAPEARQILHASYGEALAMARACRGPLSPTSIELLRAAGVPIVVGRSRATATRIDQRSTSRGIKSVALRRGIGLLHLQAREDDSSTDFDAHVKQCFARHEISMEMASMSAGEIRATVDLASESGGRAAELLDDLERGCVASLRRDLSCLSFVGTQVHEGLRVLQPYLRGLDESEIHLIGHSATGHHTSFVLGDRAALELARHAHSLLFGTESSSFAPTWLELKTAAALRAAVHHQRPAVSA